MPADSNLRKIRSGRNRAGPALAVSVLAVLVVGDAAAQHGGFGGGFGSGFGGGGGSVYGAPAGGMRQGHTTGPRRMDPYPARRIGGPHPHGHYPRRVIGPYGPPIIGLPLGIPPVQAVPDDDDPPPVARPVRRKPPRAVAPQEIADDPPPRRKVTKQREAGTSKTADKHKKPSRTAGRPPGGNAAGSSGADGSRLSGLPPAGERRFEPDEIVCVLRADMTDRRIDGFLRTHRMTRTPNGRQQIGVLGSRVFRYRITDGRDVSTVIAALERDPRVVSAQPNYRYELAQAAPAISAAPASQGPVEGSGPDLYATQYSAGKLQLREAHAIAKGESVLVAVIDSGIDAAHPEMNGAIAKQIDLLDEKQHVPHAHGTAMAGAIVARSQLMGVAPAARLLAIKAFASTSAAKGSGTTFNLTRAIDRAVEEGARVINLSFAGPADPILQRSLQAARRRGIVLVASAGNAGPNSAPLYPAADSNVIAVTATDANDRLFAGATRGSHIAVAAPGVDVLVPAPHAEYGLSTGTSVAAAHVSGVVALLLARKPKLDPDAIRAVLKKSARALASDPDNAAGAGVANAYEAIVAVDAAPAAASGIVTH